MIPVRYDVALIACTKSKNPTGINAATLYRGGTYSLIMRHAMQRCDKVMIMSAKYGLVSMTEPLRYYDLFINDLDADQLSQLKQKLITQVKELEGKKVLCYLWIPYFEVIRSVAPEIANKFKRPYLGLPTMPAALQAILTREVQNYGIHPSRR